MDRIKVKKEVEPLVSIPGVAPDLRGSDLRRLLHHRAHHRPGPASITKNCLAISLAVVLIGFFVIISRPKAMTEIVGLLMMENGLFLAAISLTYGMPMIVEIGIFFDVLVAAIIMGIFAFKINHTFETRGHHFHEEAEGLMMLELLLAIPIVTAVLVLLHQDPPSDRRRQLRRRARRPASRSPATWSTT